MWYDFKSIIHLRPHCNEQFQILNAFNNGKTEKAPVLGNNILGISCIGLNVRKI